MINPASILDLPMQENNAGAQTIRGYFIALLTELWREGEGFSGKRPFGDSGWEYDLFPPLIKAGIVEGKIDEYGSIDEIDDAKAEAMIASAILALGWVQQPEPPLFVEAPEQDI